MSYNNRACGSENMCWGYSCPSMPSAFSLHTGAEPMIIRSKARVSGRRSLWPFQLCHSTTQRSLTARVNASHRATNRMQYAQQRHLTFRYCAAGIYMLLHEWRRWENVKILDEELSKSPLWHIRFTCVYYASWLFNSTIMINELLLFTLSIVGIVHFFCSSSVIVYK